MIKYYPNILMIEVTRKCNTNCKHCMRGTKQNINIDLLNINKLLNNISRIHRLSFTGGEPSLNIEAMNYTLQELKNRNIPVNSFEIITNGINISDDFIEFVNKLISYCEKKEDCKVYRSVDLYHEKCNEESIKQLARLSCYEEYLIDCIVDIGKAKKLKIENKKLNKISKIVETRAYTCYGKMIHGIVYLTAQGDILLNCDYDYSNIAEYSLGNINNNNLEEIIDNRLYTDEIYSYAAKNDIRLHGLNEDERENAIIKIIGALKEANETFTRN